MKIWVIGWSEKNGMPQVNIFDNFEDAILSIRYIVRRNRPATVRTIEVEVPQATEEIQETKEIAEEDTKTEVEENE